ncbi:unnamed protein product [Lactuca saligna]|uniref:DYW domain-containing protein n=1 Tax=Lactuca saligna TaxID=75948 RepID=A0AA36A3P9_LACSI|nr:unnamed protein product [Lactuca saligna]
MFQATVMSFQTMKSPNHLYKVCNAINSSRSYCIDCSFKSLPFVKKFSTLNSDTIDEIFDLQNPNQFSECSQNPDGFYRQTSMGFQRNLSGAYGQSYSMGDYGFHRHSQYNINGSYNQKTSVASFQISKRCYSGIVSSQVPCYSQPNEKSDKAGLPELNKVSVEMLGYLFLMKACGESQALKEAKLVHNHLTRSGHHLDVHICNKILEMYSKCGSMEDAYNMFDKMPQKNLASWDTMITGFAKNGHGDDAIKMFTEFKKVGLKPNNQIFHGIFAACKIIGDMKQGLSHFKSMTKTYNLVPSMDDYVHVVDMLGSSGYLNEALELIEKMPMKPSAEIWEIMMNQSRVHVDLELGDRCADIVKLRDPSRLDKQSEKGLIPIKPSDIAKEKEKEKYKSSTCLKQNMVEVGYVAQTRLVLHDVDHESREEYLLSHSCMLALSEALLTSSARAPIRIINNHRICADCHDALKIISKLVGRSIVARDERRFHHFESGVCSCKDYW